MARVHQLSEGVEEQISAIERSTLKEWGSERDWSQCRAILEDWFPRLRERTAGESDIEDAFEREVGEAVEILRELRWALSYHVKETDGSGENSENDRGVLWQQPSHHDINTQPESWTHVTPVSKSALSRTVAEYLKNDWLQHNLIDWAVINASLFTEIADLGEGIKSGQLFGKMNWAYILAGNVLEKRILVEAGFSIARFVLRWVLPPLTIGAFVYFDYETPAKVVGGLWGVYLLYRLLTIPARWRASKARERGARAYEESLEGLMVAWLFTNSEVINPTRLKDLLKEADQKGKGSTVPAVVYSIVDRAIDRDPAVFLTSG